MHVVKKIAGRKMLGSSAVGGIKETQEMIDLAAKHNIFADVEVVPMNYVNTAMERLDSRRVTSDIDLFLMLGTQLHLSRP